MDRPPPSGFSLIELSIVLVVIGLLVGGIMSGQTLIHSSKLRGTIVALQNFESAFNQFKTRFRSIPGDMTNATSYWGSAGGNGSDTTCFWAQNANSTATCNGNGNGQLYWDYTTYNEGHIAWKHLANAGLIVGSFTGNGQGSSPQNVLPGVNSPVLGLNPKYGYTLQYYAPYPSPPFDPTWYSSSPAGNIITASTVPYDYKPIRSSDALRIDTKVDDSRPALGYFFVWRLYPDCVDSVGNYLNTAPNASVNYVGSDTPGTCNLNYLIRTTQ